MESKWRSAESAPGVVPEDYFQFKSRHDEDVPRDLKLKKVNVTKTSQTEIFKISTKEIRFNRDGSNRKAEKLTDSRTSNRVRKSRGLNTDESPQQEGIFDYLCENVSSIQVIRFLHSKRSRLRKVWFALFLITSLVAFVYHLYNNLSYYVQNPIYIKRIYRQVPYSSFPDLEVCSSVQVRWSKLQELEPFRHLEYVPNLIRLNRQNFYDYLRECLILYIDLRKKKQNTSGREFFDKCEAGVDFILSVMEFERKVLLAYLPRFSRNLFKSDGSFNLHLTQSSPVSYEKYEQKLKEFATNIRTLLTTPLNNGGERVKYILQNRLKIAQHFLSESFNYTRFRLAVSGDPDELVPACTIDGKACNLHITKTNNNGQVCFRIDGNSIGRSSGQTSSKLSLLLDSHALDVIETLQDVSLKVSFLTSDRHFPSAIERVILFPSTYNRVMLSKKRTERNTDCGSIQLFRHDDYTRAKCQMELYARNVYHQCGCIPAFSSTRNTESEEISVCRTTKETLCSQRIDRLRSASIKTMCPPECNNTKYTVMRLSTEPLKIIKLYPFPNQVNWTPSELNVFPKHFNVQNPLLTKLHHLLRKTIAELPSRFFPKNHICSDDPATLQAQIKSSSRVWEWIPKRHGLESNWTRNVMELEYEVMEKMDRQRVELIMELFDAAVVKKPGARITGPSWSTTTVERVLLPRYIANLMSNYRFLSPCMQQELKQFSQRLRDLQMTWYSRYRKVAQSLDQFRPGLEYNLHNFIRLDVDGDDGSEIVESFHAYSVWCFFSEVGGIMSLYLGASLIAFFEIALLLWERYFNS